MAPKTASKAGFYAVRVGHKPGIYTTWSDCEAQVKGFAGARYQKFPSRDKAEEFMEGKTPSNDTAAQASSSTTAESSSAGKKRTASKMETNDTNDPDRLIVYSDGACKGNGKAGSVAGVGVWFGHNDPRNIAERCPGDQTNNRAELIALLRVLEVVPTTMRYIIIKTDSQYSINCLTQWARKWKDSGWMTASRQPVANAGIIRLILAHFDHRAKEGQIVQLIKVKGHSGDVGNDGADAEANKGALLPDAPERDWDAEEQALRRKMESKPTLSPVRAAIEVSTTDDEGDAVVVVSSQPIEEVPAKKQKVAPTTPEKVSKTSGPAPSPRTPHRSPEKQAQASRLAAIQSALDEQASPSRTEARSAPPTCAMSPEKKQRLAQIQDALQQPKLAAVATGSPSRIKSPPPRSRQNGTTTTIPNPPKPQPQSPLPSSSRSISTAAPSGEKAPSWVKSETAYLEAKYPLRILYPPKPKFSEEDIKEYADCLLSGSEDLSKDLDD